MCSSVSASRARVNGGTPSATTTDKARVSEKAAIYPKVITPGNRADPVASFT